MGKKVYADQGNEVLHVQSIDQLDETVFHTLSSTFRSLFHPENSFTVSCGNEATLSFAGLGHKP